MIVHHFPRPCPPVGWPNLVIHAASRAVEYPEHEGPLSVKCVFRGQEDHEVRGVRYVVDESRYLLLNHGRRYSSRIRSRDEVETLSIFFEPSFAQQALRGLTEPADRLLDEPAGNGEPQVCFIEALYSHDQALSTVLQKIRLHSRSELAQGAWLDERLYEVLARLLAIHGDLLDGIERLPAVRQSTRIEQYRRLRRARDFIDSNLEGELNLAEVARVACLSPFHLLRLFKEAFAATPHQYVTRRRLDRAHALLERTDLPVSVICRRVGYESLGSFSHLFSRYFGVSPSKLRARQRRN